VILPHVVAYNAVAAPDEMARLSRAIGAADAAQGLYDLAGRLGAKCSLPDIGMPADGVERAVEATMAAPYWNPRPLDHDALRGMLKAAWEGEAPGRS
jgi:alcohol dehydrogenase class IV